MKSIMQTEKECWVCKKTYPLEEHHVFGGINRRNSEKYGLKVWLCHNHHNEPPFGVHYDPEFMLFLHKVGQRKFEETHSHEEFMKIFGRNYL